LFTLFSKILNYISALSLLFLLLILQIIFRDINDSTNTINVRFLPTDAGDYTGTITLIQNAVGGSSSVDFWDDRVMPYLGLLIVLFLLIIISLVWLSIVLKLENNIRVKGFAEKNTAHNSIIVLLTTCIIPMALASFNINFVNLLICVIILVMFGIYFIDSEEPYLNPTFLLLRYKLYRINGYNILTRHKSLDALNIDLSDNPDGICAKELVKNTYIIL